VQIVIEKEAVGAHGGIESFFACMPERRMAEIVNERQRFGEIDVKRQCGRDGTSDLRYFDGVREAVAEVIGVTAGEDLSLVFEAAKSAGMNDAVAVALKVVAVGMRRFRDAASAGVFHVDRVAGQHFRSLTGASTQYLVASKSLAPGY
jgi:hypothetical protein